ncbi:MAG: protocatechuate 3,4-dioxygenase [Acidobacteria bacterium]|nr:protocatechuate 3,4-dioxygenase [Acidobacteriota bacterium]
MCKLSSELSRRRFVGIASLATGALAFTDLAALFANTQTPPLRETADLITGPFYPLVKPGDRDADLTLVRGHHQRAAGQVVQLNGRVTNLKGEPVRNARIEIWQANTHGRYAHPSDPNTQLPLDPDFQGYALLRTDIEGRYRFTTIKPGPYPTARGDMRAPHIHFEIEGRSDRKVTQLFFPNERLNDKDRHLNSVRRPETLIANISSPSTGTELVAHWDIVLTGG